MVRLRSHPTTSVEGLFENDLAKQWTDVFICCKAEETRVLFM